MKSMQIVETSYADDFEGLIGQEVAVFTTTYIYYGTLKSVGGLFAILEDAYIVYETGQFTEANFKDSQALNVVETECIAENGKAVKRKVVRVNLGHIESIYASGQKVK